ncbi:hypothetical protein BDBG_03588 [Blastomyces gilchristii SLH14081]|uniref:C2H2-type domain-containing protein n=1 Tax=Blastomyces gilchristii (strain SLH14081) TaxID=559298 RepID=A0A179UK62_BLAGS|nr:uncharacterized protein BDBG_03588 [Blastomyces gilchristii SLH14081]OAT07537.1 hypothetical protein BDBG_03588 [Blastomyces gilchristii SLH14081]
MECIPCNRRFKNETALEKHIKYSPAHALKYDCSSCSRSFSSQNALGQHIRDSHPLRYTCNTCSRAFKTENGLEQHIEDCHPLKYDCNSCNRSFYSENALAQHIRDAPAHNPKGNNKSFKNKAAQKQRIQNPPADAHSYNKDGPCIQRTTSMYQACWKRSTSISTSTTMTTPKAASESTTQISWADSPATMTRAARTGGQVDK